MGKSKTRLEILLIRGLPGSGKSTLGKHYDLDLGTHRHIEADMAFQTPRGYEFDASRLGEAHDWCKMATERLIGYGQNVVVTNTFTTRREMEPYFEIAKRLGTSIRIIEATGNYNSVHNVPQATIDRMRARWEKYEEV